MASFGKNIMCQDFLLNSKYAFLNHGSFGAAPRSIIDCKIKLIEEQEQQPDWWFRKLSQKMWDENLITVSEFLRAKPDNLVFVSNTTTGVNAVARSLKWKEGDALLINQFTYGAVKNMCHFLAKQLGFEIITVEYPYPLETADQLVEVYDQILSKHPNVKLTILDYISSMPTMLLPVKELIALCRRHKTLIFVDGAHTPGQVDLDLENLGADFYAGNLHKWAFAVRGCAVLWVHPDYHKIIFPPVTSGYSISNWQDNFAYQGTNDNSQFYAAAWAIKYYREIGDYEIISSYNTDLVTKAADLLVEKWGTEHYPLPAEMKSPFMRMIRLPDLKKYTELREVPAFEHNAVDLNDLMFLLWERFGIQTVCTAVDSVPWVRISAMVYNCIQDYQRLADAILLLQNEQTENSVV